MSPAVHALACMAAPLCTSAKLDFKYGPETLPVRVASEGSPADVAALIRCRQPGGVLHSVDSLCFEPPGGITQGSVDSWVPASALAHLAAEAQSWLGGAEGSTATAIRSLELAGFTAQDQADAVHLAAITHGVTTLALTCVRRQSSALLLLWTTPCTTVHLAVAAAGWLSVAWLADCCLPALCHVQEL